MSNVKVNPVEVTLRCDDLEFKFMARVGFMEHTDMGPRALPLFKIDKARSAAKVELWPTSMIDVKAIEQPRKPAKKKRRKR